MKFARTILIAIRIPIDLLDQIEEIMTRHGWTNLSEFVRSAIKIFIRVERTISITNDPEKWQKFQEEMDAQISENNIIDYFAGLDDSKLKGIKMALELEEEKRARHF